MRRDDLGEIIKNLPVRISVISLALLFSLAERSQVLLEEILKGPSRNIGSGYKRITNLRNFWDHLDKLNDLEKNSVRTILWRLNKKGLVTKRVSRYEITRAGLNLVKMVQEASDAETSWDGKWRLVMFDIPEKRRRDRHWLRYNLLILDYKPLQKSVFIGKHPVSEDCYKEIIERKLDGYIRLVTVGEIDNEEFIK